MAFGNVVGETHYDASGANVSVGQAGYVDTVFAFTGKLFDDATGLQNNLSRWYDASTGRWLSEDPISFAAGDPNLYRYVNNAPTMSTDPNGLAEKSEDEGGGWWDSIKEWWSHFWPTAADGALEAGNVGVPAGTAIGGLQAGAGATGIACVRKAEKDYMDALYSGDEKEIEEAEKRMREAKEKQNDLLR